ncbi:MAG: hypothetical protein K0M45_03825 [Candidatus Paracaedibacteraceae bacterium]|nr:hypothetical protein [Candidatus Paracaedibacteraceae bacterium]
MTIKYLLTLICLVSLSKTQASIVDKKGIILPEVLKIVSIFKYAPPCNSPDLSHLNSFVHQVFLRPADSERYEKKAIQHYKKLCAPLSLDQKQSLLESFRSLGDIDSVYPVHQTYDYIVIQGATVPTMRHRLMFLVHLIENDKIKMTVNTKIIFLVGERGLYSTETPEVLLDPSPYENDPNWQLPPILPSDEREAAKVIWAQLKLPKELRDIHPYFTNTSKQAGSSRAQTQDCIEDWLKNNKVKGRMLMISSNPYISYQEGVVNLAITKAGLSNEIQVEPAGPKIPQENENIDVVLGIALDTLARTIFIEKQRQDRLRAS